MLYWDYAAATPPYEDVVKTMEQIMKLHYANPSSLHRAGSEAAKLIRRSREVCAAALSVQPKEILFTSGATESNNLAIKGAALQYQSRGRHLITTEIEHPSVYESCLQLQQNGWEITFVAPDSTGMIDPERVAAAVRRDTVLVSVMHVNNEIGTIQPLMEIGRLIKSVNSRTLFHVDGVQGYGKLAVDLKGWEADLYSLSPHKIRGPRGQSFSILKKESNCSPYFQVVLMKRDYVLELRMYLQLLLLPRPCGWVLSSAKPSMPDCSHFGIGCYASCTAFLNLL